MLYDPTVVGQHPQYDQGHLPMARTGGFKDSEGKYTFAEPYLLDDASDDAQTDNPATGASIGFIIFGPAAIGFLLYALRAANEPAWVRVGCLAGAIYAFLLGWACVGEATYSVRLDEHGLRRRRGLRGYSLIPWPEIVAVTVLLTSKNRGRAGQATSGPETDAQNLPMDAHTKKCKVQVTLADGSTVGLRSRDGSCRQRHEQQAAAIADWREHFAGPFPLEPTSDPSN